MQWENLKPLIENSLSSDKSSLTLAGDPKQSIYRWRGGDVDEFVAAFDIDGASDGAYAPKVAITGMTVSASDDTIDLLLAGSGASFSAGKLRVYAMLMDVSNTGTSKQANEVDRDYLA